jgi:hypothetical protein
MFDITGILLSINALGCLTYLKVSSCSLTKGPRKAGLPAKILTGYVQLRVTVDLFCSLVLFLQDPK